MRSATLDDGALLDDLDLALVTLPALEVDDEDDELRELESVARRPIRMTRRLRHITPTAESVTPSPSWWTLPDADFVKEGERMRMNPRPPKIPGANNIIGW